MTVAANLLRDGGPKQCDVLRLTSFASNGGEASVLQVKDLI